MVIGLRRAKGSLEVRALVRSPSTLRTDIVSFSFFFFGGGVMYWVRLCRVVDVPMRLHFSQMQASEHLLPLFHWIGER